MSDVSLLVSEEYLENDFFLSEEYEGSNDKAERKIKFIKVIFCVLCFALLCELVIYKYVMPSFSSPKVTVTGQKDYTASFSRSIFLYASTMPSKSLCLTFGDIIGRKFVICG